MRRKVEIVDEFSRLQAKRDAAALEVSGLRDLVQSDTSWRWNSLYSSIRSHQEPHS